MIKNEMIINTVHSILSLFLAFTLLFEAHGSLELKENNPINNFLAPSSVFEFHMKKDIPKTKKTTLKKRISEDIHYHKEQYIIAFAFFLFINLPMVISTLLLKTPSPSPVKTPTEETSRPHSSPTTRDFIPHKTIPVHLTPEEKIKKDLRDAVFTEDKLKVLQKISSENKENALSFIIPFWTDHFCDLSIQSGELAGTHFLVKDIPSLLKYMELDDWINHPKAQDWLGKYLPQEKASQLLNEFKKSHIKITSFEKAASFALVTTLKQHQNQLTLRQQNFIAKHLQKHLMSPSSDRRSNALIVIGKTNNFSMHPSIEKHFESMSGLLE